MDLFDAAVAADCVPFIVRMPTRSEAMAEVPTKTMRTTAIATSISVNPFFVFFFIFTIPRTWPW